MKKQALLHTLIMLSLSPLFVACGSGGSPGLMITYGHGGGNSSVSANGNGDTSSATDAQTFYQALRNRPAGPVVDASSNDANYTIKIRKMMAVDPMDDYSNYTDAVGTVSPTTGVKVWIDSGSSDKYSAFNGQWSSLPNNKISFEIQISDSFAAQFGPIVKGIGQFVAQSTASVSQSGSNLTFSFATEEQTFTLTGSIQGSGSNANFTGAIGFQNTLNSYQESLGTFTIPVCSMFAKGC